MENPSQINPFLASFSIKPIQIPRKITVHGKGTGVIYEAIDFSKFTGYSNFPFRELPEYSKGAQQVLMYILSHLTWNQDYLEIRNYETFNIEKPDKLCMKKSSFYNAIEELITRGVISRRLKRDKTYWINPSMFFHGNRMEKFSEYIIDTTPKEISEDASASASPSTLAQSLSQHSQDL